jgi:hypothetical protein
MAANHDFMRGERQMEQLLLAVGVKFGIRELIQREQKYAPC